jgi:hypothetical protein
MKKTKTNKDPLNGYDIKTKKYTPPTMELNYVKAREENFSLTNITIKTPKENQNEFFFI